jgi:magnesium chelatase family protein
MFQSLKDVMTDLFGTPKHSYSEEMEKIPSPIDIGLVRGQAKAKIGLLYSAIGRHNLLMIGPPGEGKTLLASTLPGFLPPLDPEEIAVRSQYLPSKNYPIRPFIKANQTATPSQLLGTGYSHPLPGLVTEAHGGVLFLDELSEFKPATLNCLRTPLEDGNVFITRGGSTTCFPSNFQLVGATNPCPCGYYNWEEPIEEQTACTCKLLDVLKYQRRISGPILDRIDLVVDIKEVTSEEQFLPPSPGLSNQYRAKVKECITFRELERNQYYPNSQIPGHEAFNANSSLFRWNADGLAVLKRVLDQPKFSTRKATKLAKVSRTIADTCFSDAIVASHVEVALSYVDNPVL